MAKTVEKSDVHGTYCLWELDTSALNRCDGYSEKVKLPFNLFLSETEKSPCHVIINRVLKRGNYGQVTPDHISFKIEVQSTKSNIYWFTHATLCDRYYKCISKIETYPYNSLFVETQYIILSNILIKDIQTLKCDHGRIFIRLHVIINNFIFDERLSNKLLLENSTKIESRRHKIDSTSNYCCKAVKDFASLRGNQSSVDAVIVSQKKRI